jgi:dihydropyrimidinase
MSGSPSALLLRGGELVFPNRVAKGDLLIEGEKIARIAPSIEPEGLYPQPETIDCAGLLVFPGFIDAHTHFGLGEGEARTADGFFEGSAAAAGGGVTCFVDFADQLPGKSLLQGSLTRIEEAADAVIDYTLHQGIYRFHPGLEKEIDELAEFGVRAAKLFTTYKQFGVCLKSEDWLPVLDICAKRKILPAVHAEDDAVIEAIEKRLLAGGLVPDASMHGTLRPDIAEASAILACGHTALSCGSPLYFVHVSSRLGLQAIRGLRQKGLKVIAETAPHYLLLTAARLAGPEGALALMTPPLRADADRLALWDGFVIKEIQVLATDHCSYTEAQKKAPSDCRAIPAGVPGTGEAASLFFANYPGTRNEKAQALCSVFSENPARIFGLWPRKGSLAAGSCADIALFDPEASGIVDRSGIRTAAGYSPYEGLPYFGKAVLTISRGRVVAKNGDFVGEKGRGKFTPCGPSSVFGEG